MRRSVQGVLGIKNLGLCSFIPTKSVKAHISSFPSDRFSFSVLESDARPVQMANHMLKNI
jgi:hypothetical protein